MHASAVRQKPLVPSASAAAAVAALFLDERDCDVPGVLMPRCEVQLVVRFGPTTQTGLDVHAFGARQRVKRKIIRNGQRTVTARLHLGTHEAVLGVPASAIVGAPVALEDLWSGGASRRLLDRLGDARSTAAAAAILESAIAERLAVANERRAHQHLALAAAKRLVSANVNAAAAALGVSERHLRRVFREALGVSPKAFAKVARFQRAVHAARETEHESWASIAVRAGYYDQAHLIAEFGMIAGVTPQKLLSELRAAPAIGS